MWFPNISSMKLEIQLAQIFGDGVETITYDLEWGFAFTSFWLFFLVPPQFDERAKVKSEAFYKKKTATLRAKNEVPPGYVYIDIIQIDLLHIWLNHSSISSHM